MLLAAGMGLMAGLAGEPAFAGMQIVEVAAAVAETRRLDGILLIHQSTLVALEAEPACGNLQEIAIP
jgi:hypothetical protein